MSPAPLCQTWPGWMASPQRSKSARMHWQFAEKKNSLAAKTRHVMSHIKMDFFLFFPYFLVWLVVRSLHLLRRLLPPWGKILHQVESTQKCKKNRFGTAFFARSLINPAGSGEQCCYDDALILLTSGTGAGTADRVTWFPQIFLLNSWKDFFIFRDLPSIPRWLTRSMTSSLLI